MDMTYLIKARNRMARFQKWLLESTQEPGTISPSSSLQIKLLNARISGPIKSRLRNEELLKRIVASSIQNAYSQGKKNLTRVAAALTIDLLRNPAFANGNKRTALLAGGLFLHNNGMYLRSKAFTELGNDALVLILCRVESGTIDESEFWEVYRELWRPVANVKQGKKLLILRELASMGLMNSQIPQPPSSAYERFHALDSTLILPVPSLIFPVHHHKGCRTLGTYHFRPSTSLEFSKEDEPPSNATRVFKRETMKTQCLISGTSGSIIISNDVAKHFRGDNDQMDNSKMFERKVIFTKNRIIGEGPGCPQLIFPQHGKAFKRLGVTNEDEGRLFYDESLEYSVISLVDRRLYTVGLQLKPNQARMWRVVSWLAQAFSKALRDLQ